MSKVRAVENRLEATDRLAAIESELAAHGAKFAERELSEGQAERERALAAAAIQDALKEASGATSKALEAAAKAAAEALTAALKAADTVEEERVGRANDLTVSVRDKLIDSIAEVKDAAGLALTASKEILNRHNELIAQMREKDSTYASIETVHTLQDNIDKRHVIDLDRVFSEISQVRESLSKDAGKESGKTSTLSATDARWMRFFTAVSGFAAVALTLYYVIHG
jgi:hypothetical protein